MFPLLLSRRGHKIYLSTAPNYNFVRFRALVQDVTQDFKQITDEIIRIECQLRCISPTLSLYVAEVQDYEKQHLELVGFTLKLSYLAVSFEPYLSSNLGPINH